VVLLGVLLAAVAGAPPLGAQDERVTVRIDGRPVFRVGPADTTSAGGRALRIEQRLMTLLETPGAIAPAQVARSSTDSGARLVTVSGVPVVTVTTTDAEDNLTAVDALAAQWASVIDAALAQAAGGRLSRWGRLGAEVQGSVRAAFSRLTESAIRIVPRAIAAVLVIALFWLLATGVRRLLHAVFRRLIDDLTVENLINQVAYYAIWVLGLLVAIDALGFEPQTVVTGLGLTGLALGFALKDIISNFVSGLLLLALRPFELGDQIVVGDTEGAVERIRLRATDIRTYDGRLVLVPNAEIFTSRVTNNTASPMRRATVSLSLGYGTELPRAIEVLRAAAVATEGVLTGPPVEVRVSKLGPSDLELEVRFWTDSRRSDFTATQSAVRDAVLAALREAGISLPDPDVRAIVPRHPEQWRAVLDADASGRL
jgi:small-conductance mechanosensitive channel